MFLPKKPVRFGFKNWCLCSDDGYLYTSIPYSGASVEHDKQIGLGAQVVLELLQNVDHPENHRIFFDNFFMSYYLMRKFLACGTVRKNRSLNIDFKDAKQMKRGEYDYRFDTTNELLFLKWNDNADVNIATNYETVDPLKTTKRFDRKAKKMTAYHQPHLIHSYNQHVGGVDLHEMRYLIIELEFEERSGGGHYSHMHSTRY